MKANGIVLCHARTVRGTRDGLEHAGMHLDSDITLQCFTYSVGF